MAAAPPGWRRRRRWHPEYETKQEDRRRARIPDPRWAVEPAEEPTVEKSTIVVRLRLNCNLHSLTIEELVSQRKTIQLNTLSILRNELINGTLTRQGAAGVSVSVPASGIGTFDEFCNQMQPL